MHRDGSYDDWDRLSTASYSEDMEKEDGSYIKRTIRRTSSADDVSRYHRYFKLLQKHHGKRFTWICYGDILHETIRRYKTPDVPGNIARCSSAYITASERASWAPEQEVQSQGCAERNRRKDFVTHTPRRSSQSRTSAYITDSERTSRVIEYEKLPEKLSVTRRCRDMITRASPSSKSPLSRFSSEKLSGENKSLVRDISQTIDRIAKMARKKSDKSMKHFVRTINRNGYTPVSSGYSSSEKVEVTTSCESVTSVMTPVIASSSGKRARTRKKKNVRLADAH